MSGGRPTKYSEELVAEICARIAEGQSIRTIAADEAMPSTSTIFLWLGKHQSFSDQYARAKEAQADAMSEEIMDIADDGTNDWMETHDKEGDVVGWKINGEHIQRSRLRVEARKWLMSKFAPKKYGDKQQLEHSGPNGGPILLWGSNTE